MLRRIRWWLRLFLLLLGAAAVAAIPISLVGHIRINLYVPSGEFLVSIEDASIKAVILPAGSLFSYEPQLIKLDLRWGSSLDNVLAWGVFPTSRRVGRELYFTIPLLPLALLCLAWPVTSFILARRRRKGRGFEVQTELSDQKSEVSQNQRAMSNGPSDR